MKAEVKHIILDTLRDYQPEMVGIFGSYARGDFSVNSDLDILVRFHSTLSLLQLVHLESELSRKIGVKVDLVTEGALKNKRLKENILQDIQVILES
jgi:uncharacterized protein